MVTTLNAFVERARANINRDRESGSLLLDILIGMAIFSLIAIIAVSAIGQYRMRAYTQAAVSDAQQTANAISAYITDQAGSTSEDFRAGFPTGVLTDDDLATLEVTPTAAGGSSVITIAQGIVRAEDFSVCVEYRGAYAIYDMAEGGLVDSGEMSEANFRGCDSAYIPDPGNVPFDPDDRDGDGLTNGEETAEGFDPDDAYSWITLITTSDALGVNDFQALRNTDTDGDGAIDVDEVLWTNNHGPAGKSDWRRADTDSDGLTDRQEMGGSTKPNDAYSWGEARGVSDTLNLNDGDALSGDDHDGDGLPSNIEVSTSKVNGGTYKGNLDWNSPDTDSDGWNDGDESSSGFDPTDRYSWISKAGISDAMGVTDGDFNNGVDSDRDGDPDFMEVMNGTYTR